MDVIERKVLMLRAGIKQSEIARRLGLRSQTVCLVVNGKCKSRRVEQEIARTLGLPREALWPDRT
jgi:lambda repressor-like predicted transcriptional regulator